MNSGTLRADEGIFTIAGDGWSNTGTIAVDEGTFNLGGTFTTAGLGAMTRNGGTVNLTPAIVDVSLLALALAGSHLAVGFADGAA